MLAIDIVLSGVILGGMYALIAMGLTLQYGVARIMNLAYGEFLVGAAFAAYWLFTVWNLSPLVGLIIIVPIAFVLNWAVYELLLMPLVRRARNTEMLEADSILATFGLLFVIEGIQHVMFGGQYYSYSYLSTALPVFGTAVALNRVTALLFAAVLGVALYLALTRTRFGTAIRAVAVNPAAAQLVAIDVRRVCGFTFAMGGALVAAGGVLISMFLTFTASAGVVFTMKALIVVIMGGIGNVLGALLAGLLLGLAETSVALLIDPGLTLAANYALFLAVLLWRPTGLFGRTA